MLPGAARRFLVARKLQRTGSIASQHLYVPPLLLSVGSQLAVITSRPLPQRERQEASVFQVTNKWEKIIMQYWNTVRRDV